MRYLFRNSRGYDLEIVVIRLVQILRRVNISVHGRQLFRDIDGNPFRARQFRHYPCGVGISNGQRIHLMANVGQVRRQIVVLGSGQNVEIPRDPVEQQMAAKLASGMLGILPFVIGSFLAHFVAILAFIVFDIQVFFGAFVCVVELSESVAYASFLDQNLLVLLFHVHQPIDHFHHGSVALVVGTTSPSLSIYEESQGGISADILLDVT
mmetsp:Transcript_21845/g.51814  ORF Transcript_21845/g.51814 Transcript_21845/m.51814 type:complete len:209 (+) Transcript_21845:344-970(+)